jgi:hypothetical protein
MGLPAGYHYWLHRTDHGSLLADSGWRVLGCEHGQHPAFLHRASFGAGGELKLDYLHQCGDKIDCTIA